ncbi:MAG: bifunctional aspartate kinase/homoserine dehydrogenase I [Balneola sp.]
MFVLKFGGSSVATSDSILKVFNIVKDRSKKDATLVVVSALGGITNLLQNCSDLASDQDEQYLDLLVEIEKRHLQICSELFDVKEQSEVLTSVKLVLNELEDICRGVFLIQELSPRSLDHILSFGERLSSIIISKYFRAKGFDSQLINSSELIKTNDLFGKADVDFKATNSAIKQKFQTSSNISVCAGFVASSIGKNYITTLGRGGSDYTASIFASALSAEELQIWTDVNGMMTTNPHLVPNAHSIEHISYEEAMELSHFGAKVIYPPTIQPVLDANIPIRIKNTFEPDNPGTLISQSVPEDDVVVRGISSIEDIALCTLTGSGMVAVPNISFRLFGALSKKLINVIMITQASSEHSITVGINVSDTEEARKVINKEFAYEIEARRINPLHIERDLSIVALVGSKMKQQVGVSAKLFDTLSHNGTNIRAIAQGSTELNISVVIEKKDLKKSLNSIHESFFLSDRKVVNLFMIGVGNVGKVLIEQISMQQQYLLEQHRIDLRIAGLANSRQMIFDESGLDLDNWESNLAEKSETMSQENFILRMKEFNLRNSVFIDNTASSEIPELYKRILEASISVVTPNKIAAASDYDTFITLEKTAKRFQSKFLYETNVGAGLPVISTLNDLIKSGDKVHKIQAVLSGTLNFLFNNYDGKTKFSKIVKQAKSNGLTEPDPRLDLSGLDVMRKILILARVNGIEIELDDITNHSFIPEECMDTKSLEKFYTKLDEHEEVFKNIFLEADSKGERLKYVASFEDGQASTGLHSFPPSHPFYNLGGMDNIVLFYTNRYNEQPLVIKGAGAGASVTASGIFADIMKIASA